MMLHCFEYNIGALKKYDNVYNCEVPFYTV